MTRQQAQTEVAKRIFALMMLENVRVEEFCGEVYLHGDSIYGVVAMVVKARGGKEFLTLPVELKKWNI